MRQLAQMIKKAIPGGKYSNKNNPHEQNNSVAQISRKDLGFFFFLKLDIINNWRTSCNTVHRITANFLSCENHLFTLCMCPHQ